MAQIVPRGIHEGGITGKIDTGRVSDAYWNQQENSGGLL